MPIKEDESCYLEFFGSAEPCGGLGHLSLGWDLERAELFHVVRKQRTAVSWDSLRQENTESTWKGSRREGPSGVEWCQVAHFPV